LLCRWRNFNGVALASALINGLVFVAVQPVSGEVVGVLAAGALSFVFTFVLNHSFVFREQPATATAVGRGTGFQSIAWFLPAHEEAGNLPILVPEIISYLRSLEIDFDVIVVNDGSADETGLVAEQLALGYEEVSVVHHDENRGYGATLRSGFRASLQTERDLIGFCDSDLQFRIKSLGPMLEVIENFDLVLGYRIQRADGIKRRLMGRGWHHTTSAVIGFSARDTDCGFKLFRRSVIQHLMPELSGDYATISPELIARAERSGFSIAEVGVEHFPRYDGNQSGASLRVIFGSFRDLYRIRKAVRST
jgi:glycosyltransferase involved in cell wall biosynthesis